MFGLYQFDLESKFRNERFILEFLKNLNKNRIIKLIQKDIKNK